MESLIWFLFPKIFILSINEIWLLGVGVVHLFFTFYLFKYNLFHYKDTLLVSDQIILVFFAMLISGQLAQITIKIVNFYQLYFPYVLIEKN